MRTTHHIVWAAATAAAVFALSSAITAGPLGPPPGPVVATGKTLDDVEPRIPLTQETAPGDAGSLFVISEPGSYYLAGDITTAEPLGIQIDVSDVTLDLNGFTVRGTLPIFESVAGVRVSGVASFGVEIRNGVLTGWRSGVLVASENNETRIIDVRASHNNSGIVSLGGAFISGCVASFNSGKGISTSRGSTVVNCIADRNALQGFDIDQDSIVTGCAARRNGSAHAFVPTGGFSVGLGVTVSNCVAIGNVGDGFQAGAVVSLATDNDTVVAQRTDPLFSFLGGGFAFTNCVANKNSMAGFNINVATSTVSGCTVSFNMRDGIRTDGESLIINNNCVNNGGDGIVAGSASVISDNTCSRNGANEGVTDGAGIRVQGNGTRVENNAVAGNDIGIRTLGACFVAKNTASGNGVMNYDLADGATFGPIVSVTGDLSRTDAGHHPWANFEY